MRATQAWGTVLVTGASAGLGHAFCHQLAAAGSDIVAVARRADRLEQLARDLGSAHGVRVTPIVADLADPAAPEMICTRLAGAGIRIDTLVNNAGYGVPGRFLSQPWSVHARYQNVMLGAVAQLSYALLPAMLAQGHGRVINVASLAGFLPGTAGHTLYAASKAWMIHFSESLDLEYRAEGVRVCAVCPGFTYTEFHDVTGTRAQVARLPAWLWATAETVVRDSLTAVENGHAVFIPGRINRMIARAARWLPRAWIYQLSARESRRFRDAR